MIRLRRSLERKWRSDKLEIHRQIYREQCRKVNNLIRDAKTKYYANIIEEKSNDQKALFKFVRSLTTSSSKSSLPTHDTVNQLTETFSNYFTENIVKIRSNLDAHSSDISLQSTVTANNTTATISSFQPTTTDEVYNIIKKAPSKSCCLDPIPTHLLKKTQHTLIPFNNHHYQPIPRLHIAVIS